MFAECIEVAFCEVVSKVVFFAILEVVLFESFIDLELFDIFISEATIERAFSAGRKVPHRTPAASVQSGFALTRISEPHTDSASERRTHYEEGTCAPVARGTAEPVPLSAVPASC
jgi:hypothetical protein